MKPNRKKHVAVPIAIMVAVSLAITVFAGCHAKNPGSDPVENNHPVAEETVTIQGDDSTATTWVSKAKPDINISNEKDNTYIDVGLGEKGAAREGLVRFNLPVGVAPEDLISAELRLKKIGGNVPKIRAGIVTIPWGISEVCHNDIDGMTIVKEDAPICKRAKMEWYCIDVTDIVKGWLSGDYANYGFALTGAKENKMTRFFSANAKDPDTCPQLVIQYKDSSPSRKYGKYDYRKQPPEEGNCLSYALRDTDAITLEDLVEDDTEFFKISENGSEATLEYLEERITNYMDAHKKELGIESYRLLSGFDTLIDPAKEYMVAIKIGTGKITNDPDAPGFDYHLRIRLADGSWSEKLQGSSSRIVPGSNEALDEGKYPWDADYMWGYPKWTDYYSSSTAYMAVTKSTDFFTSHKH
ncbi:MAG: DNRLRE domain-containing protein [Clostridiales Family XIII bacterium]|jgi:hypothetical protein|nr:DNRLRE domain-containing protein [Clostridiales Family XIII bacterium]